MKGLSRAPTDAGFTLIELLIAAALVLGLSALTVDAIAHARTVLATAADRSEMQQRARAGLESMMTVLRAAGAGSDRATAAGPLVRWLPPVWPGRSDARSDRSGDGRSELSTAITALQVVAAVPPATLARDASAGDATLEFDHRPGCAMPCGFFDRMRVVLLDGRGDFDLFVLTETDGTTATVRRLPGGTGGAYVRGNTVLPVEIHTYYVNARTHELRTFDGDRSDLPVANDVVDLNFEYLGDPMPPVEPRPPPGEANCLYDSAGAVRGGQLFPVTGGTLAPIETAMLTDGPWCGAGSEPFDADLLRLRVVRIALRLQATSPASRGTDARWFRNPGTATDAAQMVKDLTVQTTVVPLNLGGWR